MIGTEAREGFVDLPGVRIYYEAAGPLGDNPARAEPLVFLHGGGLDAGMWDDQIGFFTQRYRIVRYDQRAAGRSETAPRSEPYVPYRDLEGVLDALAIPRATLIGHSGGARLAIDFAIAYPGRVAKLALVSPGMSGYQFSDEWTKQRFAAVYAASQQGNLAEVVEIFLTLWTDGPYRAPDAIDPALRERVRAMGTRTLPLSRLAAVMQELDPPALGRIAEIKAPTLVALGDRDTADILAIGGLLREQVAGAQAVTFAGAGHNLVMEQPDAFNALLEQFLAGEAVE